MNLLLVFMSEIGLKTFVQGFRYYQDIWNSLDAVIVIGSYIIGLIIQINGLAVLRLLRLLRLVVVLRKVSANTKRKKAEQFASIVDEVIFILKQLSKTKKMPNQMKKGIKEGVEIIESNKIDEVQIRSQDERGQSRNMDTEHREWYRLCQASANDPQLWFDRDLDDYLYERQRDNEA